MMQIDSKTAEARSAHRRIRISLATVLLNRSRRKCGENHFFDGFRIERFLVQPQHLSGHTNGRRKTNHEEQIAAAAMDQRFEPSFKLVGPVFHHSIMTMKSRK